MSNCGTAGSSAARKIIDDLADKYRHVFQDGPDGAPCEGLTFPKDYLNNRINILGLFLISDRQGRIIGPYGQAVIFENVKGLPLNNDIGRVGIEIANRQSVEGHDGTDGDNEFMLIGDIENMKPVKQVVAAKVRFKIAEFLCDFFAGDLYLSIRENALKANRFPAKGELNLIGLGPKWAQDVPSQMIERASEIVNRISNYEREMVGEGRVYIDAQGALTGLSIVMRREHSTFLIENTAGLSFKVFDVMLGPA